VIPPQSDERTALIDRGLILRGLLTEEQIKEIHRIGDLWLARRDLAGVHRKAYASGEEAVRALRRQKAEQKAAKKVEAAARKKQRAEAVLRRKAEDIVFLGAGVSSKLHDRRSHIEALRERGLPVLSTPADVASALGVTVPELRWLCYHNEAADRMHYVQFSVPKRSGGTRLLAAPLPMLASAQEWVLRSLLDKLPAEPPAHGFIKGRSTVTNARLHTDRDLVVNLDLSDFFPSITWRRVRGVFEKLGYSPAVATVLALLCTEPPRRRAEYEGRGYWVAIGERALPQGAPTSPALSNQVARKLDRRLSGMSAKTGWTYTRYADDLTFSAARSGQARRGEPAMLLARVRHIVTEEGFSLNPKKGRVQRAGGRQSVTGIVVNHGLSLPREEIRRLRAVLHNAKKTGLMAQNREGLPDFAAHIRGKIAYLHMVDPERALPLLQALEALTGRGAEI
jgi:retron-type reverse transcriptase